jgi:hypothetical protein
MAAQAVAPAATRSARLPRHRASTSRTTAKIRHIVDPLPNVPWTAQSRARSLGAQVTMKAAPSRAKSEASGHRRRRMRNDMTPASHR